MENIGEENKEDFLHDLRILYLNIFYHLTLPRKLKGRTSISLTSSSHHFFFFFLGELALVFKLYLKSQN
jgi:hypothetical protein